jgi:hypothetical protein
MRRSPRATRLCVATAAAARTLDEHGADVGQGRRSRTSTSCFARGHPGAGFRVQMAFVVAIAIAGPYMVIAFSAARNSPCLTLHISRQPTRAKRALAGRLHAVGSPPPLNLRYGLRRTFRAARLTSSGQSTLSVLVVPAVAGRPGVPGIMRLRWMVALRRDG